MPEFEALRRSRCLEYEAGLQLLYYSNSLPSVINGKPQPHDTILYFSLFVTFYLREPERSFILTRQTGSSIAIDESEVLPRSVFRISVAVDLYPPFLWPLISGHHFESSVSGFPFIYVPFLQCGKGVFTIIHLYSSFPLLCISSHDSPRDIHQALL